jgi:hypothetical protein
MRTLRAAGQTAKNLARAGFSMLELIIGTSILALILGNIVMLQGATGNAYESGVFGSALEESAEITMDRIALAIMSTSVDRLEEVLTAPSFVTAIEYEVVTDVVDGIPVVGLPERIELDSPNGKILWTRNPDEPDEMQLIWSKWVPVLLEGEGAVPNGEDDNDNGVEDEGGLAFNRDASQITIRLTLSRTDSHGVEYTRTRSRRITCRN